MMCLIAKWYVSRSLDSGKRVPALIRRHLEKCADCRKFERACRALEKRAAQDARTMLGEIPDDLSGRIKSHVFQSGGYSSETRTAAPRRRSRLLIPIAAAALAAALIAAAVFFQPFQIRTPETAGNAFSFLQKIPQSGETLKKLSSNLESPYEKELEVLKKAVRTASRSVLDKLDLRIGT